MRFANNLILIIFLLLTTPINALEIVNIYGWGNEIPLSTLHHFEKETGIKVNFTAFDSNEALYAKIKTQTDYDIIMPSNYYVSRLINEGLLEKINYFKISNGSDLKTFFKNPAYDPKNTYSVPYNISLTGIFYHPHYIDSPPMSWRDLWQPKFNRKLLLLDDAREIFSMALLTIGASANSTNPSKIHKAYQQLLQLKNNIRLLSTNTIQSLIIDEDVVVGMSWNSDIAKVQREGSDVRFIFPEEGYVLSIDCFAILKSAPHKENAYKLINFLLEPRNITQAIIKQGVTSPSIKANQHLPKKLRNNTLINPTEKVLKGAHYQADLPTNTLRLLIHYWQLFKLSF